MRHAAARASALILPLLLLSALSARAEVPEQLKAFVEKQYASLE